MKKKTVKFKKGIYFDKMEEYSCKLPKKLIEKDVEKILIYNLNKIEKGMKYISSQYRVAGGVIDILARDRNNTLCIIELKIIPDCKDAVFQSLYYPTQFKERTRMIVIAPSFTKQMLKVLNMFDYIEKFSYYIDNKKNIFIEKIKEGELKCI